MAANHPTPPVIVKLGGSLLRRAELKTLLAVAAEARAVVVPGGGPFADAVRAAQGELAFSDRAAHRAAILAMEQMAAIFADLAPDLAECERPEAFEAAFGRGHAALWRPARMATEADLPNDWSVTSDSLALWLARALGARKVVLVKAAQAVGGAPDDWALAGLVDAHLPRLAAGFPGEIALVGGSSPDALRAALAAPLRSAA